MNSNDKCQLLVDKIVSFLKEGITLDIPTRRYIDACLPGISLEEVAHRLCDMPDFDIAPLMDLIFFPNETLQLRLEPLIEKHHYSRNDEATVTGLLESKPVQTTLREPESRPGATFQIPVSVYASFVRRLNISRRIPSELADAISAVHPPEIAARLKVMLRNTRFSYSRPVAGFLTAFILGMEAEDKDFDACFELMIDVLETMEIDVDPFRLLRMKTEALYRAHNAALQFEKQLRRSNMETLMQLGLRAPETSASEANKKIDLLERIGRTVAMGGYLARRQNSTGSSNRKMVPLSSDESKSTLPPNTSSPKYFIE